ncbi:MAG: glycerol-3-phosphate acyltransferase [Pseudothermotoga sp.]|uniref:glycerol-3-phosphate acyltransferase n=1 Tax=Pseudothermotoga sp. TaxID=2033661 RepID=UPI000A9BEDAB|nr:glycerol-3-phosphate acyltransferase [Pseudothermotoga sp.]
MFEFSVVALQFLSGSIMYSYILARINGVDLRKVRDGNPGSSNLWRAKGFKWGALALGLDYFKGTFPLFLFIASGALTNRYVISLAALAGVAGHAFSPMLKFKGGKAVATTFGAWSVLTKWEAPAILGGVFSLFSLLKRKTAAEEDAFRVLLGLIVLFAYTLYKALNQETHLLVFYLGNFTILTLKHWKDWRKFLLRLSHPSE